MPGRCYRQSALPAARATRAPPVARANAGLGRALPQVAVAVGEQARSGLVPGVPACDSRLAPRPFPASHTLRKRRIAWRSRYLVARYTCTHARMHACTHACIHTGRVALEVRARPPAWTLPCLILSLQAVLMCCVCLSAGKPRMRPQRVLSLALSMAAPTAAAGSRAPSLPHTLRHTFAPIHKGRTPTTYRCIWHHGIHAYTYACSTCDTKGGRGRIFTDLVKFETVSRSSLREVSDWHLLQTCLKSLSYFEIVETVSRSSRRQYRTCSCARSSRASVHDRGTRVTLRPAAGSMDSTWSLCVCVCQD